MSCMNRIPHLVALLALLAGNPLLCHANPSHKDTNQALAIHGKELTKAIYQQAVSLDSKARERVLDFLKQESAGRVEQISAKDIGQTHLATTQLLRLAEQLLFLGEPAGLDFQKRVEIMRKPIARITQQSKSYPATQKYINQWRSQIQKQAPARAKTLERVQQLASSSNWLEAEKELYELFDMMEPGTVFFESEEKRVIYEPFNPVQGAITNAMQEIRRQQGSEALQQAIADTTPNHVGILDEIQLAIQSVAQTGTASYRDSQVNGPQLVTKIADTWREAQNAILQARAKQWALQGRPNYGGAFYPMSGNNSDTVDPYLEPHRQFSDNIAKLLAQLIQVDAMRVPSEQASALYQEYLVALAPLVRQHYNRDLLTFFNQALLAFGNKLPQGGAQVGNYSAATSELLRWRAKVATAQTQAARSQYNPLPLIMRQATTSKDPYVGLFPEDTSYNTTATLMTASSETMPLAVERLLNKQVLVNDVIRISDSSPTAIARYQERTYANVTVAETTAAVAALKKDLLVTESLPALNLEATQAILSAERGDWQTVGGVVAGTHLEGVVTRFGSLPAAAAILTPLGTLPTDNMGNGGLAQMLIRFDVTPQWVAHQHFFTRVNGK